MKHCLIIFLLTTVQLGWAAPIEQLSRREDGKSYRVGISQNVQMSEDGKIVAFESTAQLSHLDTNQAKDVYVLNRSNNTLYRMGPPNSKRINAMPSVNKSGKSVVFHSYRPGALDVRAEFRGTDLYIFNMATGDIDSIPLKDFGLGEGEHLNAFFSGDKGILYTSNASVNAVRQIYFYDQNRHDNFLLSQTSVGKPANRLCGLPKLSSNGDFVAFLSAATNFTDDVPAQSVGQHLFLRDIKSNTVTRLDTLPKGFDDFKWAVVTYTMDATADRFVWEARFRNAKNPVESYDQTNLYIYERKLGLSRLLSIGPFLNKSKSPSLNSSGRYMAMVSLNRDSSEKGALYVVDLEKDKWEFIVEGKISNPVLSGDGCVVAYESEVSTVLRHVFLAPSPFSMEMQCPPFK